MKINQLINESQMTCNECGGPSFSNLILAEKQDACYHKVKASAKVWPSAYASGRLVQCRKKGAANYGNKSKNEGVAEATGDQPFDSMMKTIKKGTARQATADRREQRKQSQQQARDAFGTMFGGGNPADKLGIRKPGVAEGYDAEYDDEAGMAGNNLETLRRAVDGIDDVISPGDNLPEWCQEKIAVAKSMLVSVWNYMKSEDQRGDDSDQEDPEIVAMYEAMEDLVQEIAAREKSDVELVWESFESLSDHMLYETAAWKRKEGKSKKGGLNAKGVASYRRENPGSKLQTAVTTKPSKLKKGSKAAKRRKSFCARMSGVKGPMKKPNGKPTRKALALRKWNC